VANDSYRWIGLTGILTILVNYWLGSFYRETVARFLLLLFALLYWRNHRDTFSILLLICAVIVFILGTSTISGIFVAPNLI
jgi:hypothetical protein